jgi:uncharacterized protein with FMN-binding domain
MAVVLLFAALGVVEHSEPSMRPVISDGHYLPIHELLGSSEYDVVDASGIRYYVVRDEEDNPLQATFIAERNGFKGPVRFLIVLDAEHVIKDVTIVKQEESAGFGELITRRSFLDQFTGLEKDSPFTVDETTGYVDGTYLGQASSFGGPLEVEVVVQGGKIASVTILKHSDTPGFSDPAINGIPDRIVAENNPAVDVASGATVSSEAIMAAVRSALESTSASGFAITVSDGTYQGRAQGFGGTLVLDVVVSGGKITEIVVVESGETPFIANAAFNELIPALIDAQGPVDAISGATVTSGAIHDAVRDALNEKEGQ